MKNDWPVLKSYDEDHLLRIALPLGGIGTGTVSLGGRGDLRDWELVNRPAKGYAPQHTFFAIQMQQEGKQPIALALEGPLDLSQYEGQMGAGVSNHGLARFRNCTFEAAYPLGQVILSDNEVPLQVRMQAYNPFVPGDSDASGIPLAVLRYVVTNTTDEPMEVSICGNLQNFIGCDGVDGTPEKSVNEFRHSDALAGVFLRSELDSAAPQSGTLALAVLPEEDFHISHRTAWNTNTNWNLSLLDFWDDFLADGEVENREGDAKASLAARFTLPAGSTRAVTFLLAWHFPNRLTWTPQEKKDEAACCDGGACGPEGNPDIIGNYYTTQFADAWNVLETTAPRLAQLEESTVEFVRAFCQSDLPEVVKEAALFNLSTLRSQTCFRTPDGHFFGWEGCGDKWGCCLGSCTHVWNYEHATPFLFGDLTRSMREIEFAHATHENGLMSFRVYLPISRAQESPHAAADGQLGCLMKLHRDWQLYGNDEWLRELWPHARRALEFCWIKGGWDADRDGVMEGCQHNTMDVEYYGPNPQMQGWYLGALRACEEMAGYLGEEDFAATCRDLFQKGSAWMDAHLWNGEYYEHEVRPQRDEDIAPGLRVGMGTYNFAEPELQLGAGCLVDQLVGQYTAHVCGLGYLHDQTKVRTTLQSILRYNRKSDFFGHFNHMRSYVLGDETALMMATYPLGRRPVSPFPYFNEVMTGFEYTAAIGMLQEGDEAEGLACIEAIRDRYDGRKRSPFDEAECGHHYARAMASWAAVLALTGFAYSGVTKTLKFKSSETPVTWFWSTGDAWGNFTQQRAGEEYSLHIEVKGGTLRLRRLELTGFGALELPQDTELSAGQSAEYSLKQ